MRDPFDGLDPEQSEAVEAVRGPVCILAGAGTGKTTTITRRIANQVLSGEVPAGQILAVAFTDKAAREMASRLGGFEVRGVRVKTFHAEALAQYARLSGTSPEILPNKAALLSAIAQRLPPPYRFKPVRDIATEIEWAKNRLVRAEAYLEALGDHKPPLPPEIMAGVYGSYERRKRRARLIDFEDLLELTLNVLRDPRHASVVHARYAAFTVDEYQDVNLLQQRLLEAWLGTRDDVCVVGDDHQSIFSFTGADPGWLLSFPDRYPHATVVTLTRNYRSTPDVLAVANRLTPRLGGTSAPLRATRPEGPHPALRSFRSEREEITFVVEEVRRLYADGVAYEDMAVLLRINGRSEDFEEALAGAGIPFQVRDGAFLRRPAARAALARLRRERGLVAEAVGRVVEALGLGGKDAEDAGSEEATRQADLERLLRLSREFPGDDLEAFAADLRSRFAVEEQGRGVVLLTYHRAKGLEFDTVFLPRLEEGELPFALATSEAEVDEERRLLYVGITRARRHLYLSWALARSGRRARPLQSRFISEISPDAHAPSNGKGNRPAPRRGSAPLAEEAGPLLEALRTWRLRVSRDTEKPAYTVFSNDTLERIASVRPESLADLYSVPGVGPSKLARYGEEVLAIVKSVSAAEPPASER